jgi:hypothetical protein
MGLYMDLFEKLVTDKVKLSQGSIWSKYTQVIHFTF